MILKQLDSSPSRATGLIVNCKREIRNFNSCAKMYAKFVIIIIFCFVVKKKNVDTEAR